MASPITTQMIHSSACHINPMAPRSWHTFCLSSWHFGLYEAMSSPAQPYKETFLASHPSGKQHTGTVCSRIKTARNLEVVYDDQDFTIYCNVFYIFLSVNTTHGMAIFCNVDIISVLHQITTKEIQALELLSLYFDVVCWSVCTAPYQIKHTYTSIHSDAIDGPFSL